MAFYTLAPHRKNAPMEAWTRLRNDRINAGLPPPSVAEAVALAAHARAAARSPPAPVARALRVTLCVLAAGALSALAALAAFRHALATD